MDTHRIARLTDRQRYCLRLVHARMSSQEIAPRLRVAPGTVDQIIAAAARTLGVSDHHIAARILAEQEAGAAAAGPPAAAPGDAETAIEVLASIRHGFANLLNFSGRDTRRQFQPYAALLLIVGGALAFGIVVSHIMTSFVRLQQIMATQPGTATKITMSNLFDRAIDHGLLPGFERQAFLVCVIAALYFVLIAAALARRRHDRDIVEAAGALSLPLIAVALALVPRLIPLAFALLALVGLLYALIRGGAPERVAVGLILAGASIEFVIMRTMPHNMVGLDPAIFAVDALFFPATLLLALTANRFWPMWLAAMSGLGLAVHLASILDPERLPWAYMIANAIWGYPMLLALIAGTWAHRRRLARYGSDPAWTPRRRAAI